MRPDVARHCHVARFLLGWCGVTGYAKSDRLRSLLRKFGGVFGRPNAAKCAFRCLKTRFFWRRIDATHGVRRPPLISREGMDHER